MINKIFYHPYNPDNNPILDCIFDLEPLNPPHIKYSSPMGKCPAMHVYKIHTYIVRSPFDFTLEYIDKKWQCSENIKNIIIEDGNPYIQIQLFYLFWSEKKSKVKLWQSDPPLYTLNNLPTWYVTSGMIPIGEYTRNTSVGFILKPNEIKIEIKRGDALCSFTLVGDSHVELIKKVPSEKILRKNVENYSKKNFCPYTFSKKLFQRWFK